jgi:hypothetical protein
VAFATTILSPPNGDDDPRRSGAGRSDRLDLPGVILAQLLGTICAMGFVAWLLSQPEEAG